MENIILDSDIKVLCVKAKSFPDGIMDAHQKIHTLVSFSKERRYFGISHPGKKGAIVYRAAVEEKTEGEAKKLNLEELVIKNGQYTCLTINDYMNNLQKIGQAFDELTALPDIDPNGYCVEWYLNEKDVRCMFRLKS
jgi:predicted transcriptional regulator YdeE